MSVLSPLSQRPPERYVTYLSFQLLYLSLQSLWCHSKPTILQLNYVILIVTVLSGIRHHGFLLGFNATPLQSARRNKNVFVSASRSYRRILEQRSGPRKGRWSIYLPPPPPPPPPMPNLHISSFRVIPKSGQPGKWCLIVDLSAPEGRSVNDGTDPDDFSLQYVKEDDVIRMIGMLGTGALMAKFDVLRFSERRSPPR